MVKSLLILHVKIALVLPSLMGIVDGPQSSSLAMLNVQLGSSQDFDRATQEHFLLIQPLLCGFSSVLQIIVLMKCESPTQFQIHG